MHRVLFKVAALLATLSVMLGAFGAHLFKRHLSAEDLSSFNTAVTYQMTHAIGIFIAGILFKHYLNQRLIWAGYFFTAGVLLFSGSIYSRLLFNFLQLGYGNKIIMLAPLGGVLFMLGWVLVFIAVPSKRHVVYKHREKD
jgi:uncharacterized membrane protein YgdD (TMEM256/DUF423 family)